MNSPEKLEFVGKDVRLGPSKMEEKEGEKVCV